MMEQASKQHTLSKLKILVVDDEECNRRLLKRLLEFWGFEFAGAASYGEAVRVMDESFFLVITDCRMPGASGLDLARDFRLRWPGIPILAVTGSLDEEIEAGFKSLGVKKVFKKPLDSAALKMEIETLVFFVKNCR